MGAPGTAQRHAVVRSPSHRGGRHGPRHHSRVSSPSEWKRGGGWGALGTVTQLPSVFRAWMNSQWHPERHLPTGLHLDREPAPPQLAPRDARNPLPPDLINPPSQPLQKLLYHPSSQITPSQPNGSLPSKTPSHDHNPFNINRYRPPHTNHHRHRHYHHHNKPPRSSSHDPQHKGPPGVPQGRDRHTYIRTLSSGEGPGRAPIPLPGVILSESISTHDPVPRPVNVARKGHAWQAGRDNKVSGTTAGSRLISVVVCVGTWVPTLVGR